MSTINGKKPIASKPKKPIGLASFGNILDIPSDLKEELDKAGLVGRWLDSKEVFANQGYSKRGWRVYIRPRSESDKLSSFRFGNDPDGVVRRGTCLLGVKSLEEVEEHKQMLDFEAAKKSGQKHHIAENLRAEAKSRGLKTLVKEFEEEEGE